jgi:hypothetical protein
MGSRRPPDAGSPLPAIADRIWTYTAPLRWRLELSTRDEQNASGERLLLLF